MKKWLWGLSLFAVLGLAACNTYTPPGSDPAPTPGSTSEVDPPVGGDSSESEADDPAQSDVSSTEESVETPVSEESSVSEDDTPVEPPTSEDSGDDTPVEPPVEEIHYVVDFVITGKPDYATLRLIGSHNDWAEPLDETTEMKAVEGATDTYRFDFGNLDAGTVISYKIVATTSASTSVWGSEGAYAGTAKDEKGNPTLTVAENPAAVTDWSFPNWPADPESTVRGTLVINVKVDNYEASSTTYEGIGVKGDFDGWTQIYKMTLTDGVWSVTIPDLALQTYGFKFITYLGDNPVNWATNADNLSVTVVEGTTTVDYLWSIGGAATIDAGTSEDPVVPDEPAESTPYTATWTIANVPDGVEIHIAHSLNNWDAVPSESNVLTPVADTADTYSYEFDLPAGVNLIQYKLIATLAGATNVWNDGIEGSYSGYTWENQDGSKNPYIVPSETTAAIEGWSWAGWPILVSIEVTITDMTWQTWYVGFGVRGDFRDTGWSNFVFAEVAEKENTYAGEIVTVPGSYSWGFCFFYADSNGTPQQDTNAPWIGPAGGGNLSYTFSQSTSLVYSGTTSGVTLVE